MIGSCLLLLLESPPEPGIDAFVASIPQGQQNPMPAEEILRINPNTNGCGIVDLKSLRSELDRLFRLQLWECPEPESEVYDGVITENPPRFLKSEGFVVRTEAIPASRKTAASLVSRIRFRPRR